MNLNKIDIDSFSSDIECEFFIDDEERILLLKVNGNFRRGTLGSLDCGKVYMKAASYYHWIEPASIIFNLSNATYSFGNSIVKLLHFTSFIGRDEEEKKLPNAYIISEKNDEGIASILQVKKEALPSNYFYDLGKAVSAMESMLDFN
jgi:hypothetical protein